MRCSRIELTSEAAICREPATDDGKEGICELLLHLRGGRQLELTRLGSRVGADSGRDGRNLAASLQ